MRTGHPALQFIVTMLLGAPILIGQTPPERPKIFGVAHVAIDVSNLDRARTFYCDFLGFAQPYSIKSPDGKDWIFAIKVNDNQYLELFAGRPDNLGQFDHIAFYTDDVTGMEEYLASRHVPISERVHAARNGNLLLSLKDPEGRLLEIVQYTPGSWTSQDKGQFLPNSRIATNISHIAVAVYGAPSVSNFYTRVFGFRTLVSRSGRARQSEAPIFLGVPEGRDYLELLPIKKRVSADQLREWNHVGLLSPEGKNVIVDLRGRGQTSTYRIKGSAAQPGPSSVFDPDGARLEIIEKKSQKSRP